MAAGPRSTLGLTLLLCAGAATAQPPAPPAMCRVFGRVFEVGAAGDTVPVVFANVSARGPRLYAQTDETGAFVLNGLPPGRVVIQIQSLGSPNLLDTLDLVAGQTIRRLFRAERPRFDVVRDSLTALGQWPPALDSTLLEHMRTAHDVRVFRLDPDHPAYGAPPDPEHRVAAWRIVHEAHRPAHHDIERLTDALRAAPYHLQGFPYYYMDCGGFWPALDVRFTRDGVPVDVLLCYRCNEMSIWRAGRLVQSGDFQDGSLTALARHAFPHDKVLRELTEPHHTPPH